jgi:hypothetical protein
MANLTAQELKNLRLTSLTFANAKALAQHLESDPTAGGIFPNGKNGNFSNPNIETFEKKWGWWWEVAKDLLSMAKTFTGPKLDLVIDALIMLGEQLNMNPKSKRKKS